MTSYRNVIFLDRGDAEKYKMYYSVLTNQGMHNDKTANTMRNYTCPMPYSGFGIRGLDFGMELHE